jgi:hypothetical protein
MEIIQQKRKTSMSVDPQIFGLLIEFPNNSFISVQCAYSLEEAFALAKLEYKEQNYRFGKRETFVGAKINLFTIKTLDALLHAPSLREVIEKTEEQTRKQMNDVLNIFKKIDENSLKNLPGFSNAPLTQKQEEVEKPKTVTLTKVEKNKLMKQIVKDKDKGIFKKNKDFFTIAEQSYLLDRLK